MPELFQFALNAAVAPAVILTSHADNQGADGLPQARPAHPPGHVSPLPGDQTAVPAHQRIGGDERGDRIERPSPEARGLRCQSTTLIVSQLELPATTLLFEDPVLLDQVGDHVLLVPVHPARNRQQEQLERESRGRHSAIVGALNAHAHRQLRTDPFFAQHGMQAEQRDAVGGLQIGFLLALFGIFALLAIPLKSYVQPLIIMSAIPFGFVGAVWGHIIMGLDVTMMSMMGLVALSGVVVNDSLIMIDFINRKRRLHADLGTAVQQAGMVRFRPILLTSLTTFAGLAPLMIERSMQAAFLVPMAVSLAFGVVFATFITLVLVPTAYMIVEDIRWVLRRVFGRPEPADAGQADQTWQPVR